MTPIHKAAMTIVSWKAGDTGIFGWYNNLDISDGSTIPGLSDRVMAWDDRDESFSGEEQTIKSQSRYNPTYDLKGFYYRWIEPRFKPELFDDMTRDYSNTTPAKRFAATLDPTLTRMLSVMKTIEDEIINDRIKATRIVISDDLINVVKKILVKEGLQNKAYRMSESDDIYSIWIFGSGVSGDNIDKAEQYFQNVEGSEQYEDLVEDLLGGKSIVSSSVEKIVETAKEICKKYETDDLYLVGEYARKIFDGDTQPFVSELDFVCEDVDMCLKIGTSLANKLNIDNEFITVGKHGIILPYRGIRIIFSRAPFIEEIGEKMNSGGYNVQNAILREICNRDFTINMMIYDVRQSKVIDPIGVKSDISNKIVKTLFDPSFVIENNPMVIMRAISLRLDGYTIDEDLERSIIECAPLINNGRFSPERLNFTREFLKSKGINEAEAIFNEYGLDCNEKENIEDIEEK
jgi:hypothetical protein